MYSYNETRLFYASAYLQYPVTYQVPSTQLIVIRYQLTIVTLELKSPLPFQIVQVGSFLHQISSESSPASALWIFGHCGYKNCQRDQPAHSSLHTQLYRLLVLVCADQDFLSLTQPPLSLIPTLFKKISPSLTSVYPNTLLQPISQYTGIATTFYSVGFPKSYYILSST